LDFTSVGVAVAVAVAVAVHKEVVVGLGERNYVQLQLL
jgi:hypothetical protein